MAGSEIAVRQLPGEITRMFNDDLPEDVFKAALATGKWKDAIDKGAWGAIANALVMCKTYHLDPFAGPDQVYVIPYKGAFVAYPSAWGRLMIARQSADFDGMTVEGEWED